MKTCPFCAEQIQAEAIKCRFCGEFLHKKEDAAGETPATATPEEQANVAARQEGRQEAERVTKELLHNWKFARWFP